MRLGNKTLGHYRLGQPDVQTVTNWQDYLDGLATYMGAGLTRAEADAILGSPRYPYQGGTDGATAVLYPSLSDQQSAETVLRGGTAGYYQIRLDDYGVLPYWRSATWTQRINEPDVLTFDYPAAADLAEYLVRPNMLSLYDQFGDLQQVFALTPVVPDVQRDGNGITVQVTAKALLAQLQDEYVTTFWSQNSIGMIVANLLTQFQESDRAFSIGEIYEGIAYAGLQVSFQGKPLLECLQELWRLSGQKGQFTVTPSRQFVWKERLGSAKAIDIKLGYNLRSLKRQCNQDEMATRLYVYGEGLGYGQRPVAMREANVATYGLIIKRITVEGADSGTVGAYADELILVTSVPPLEYSVSAADLYSLGLGQPITLGCLANIEDADLGIITQQTVIGITRRLDNPLDATFEFARRHKDMRSVIETLGRRIGAQETRDHTRNVNAALVSGSITGVPRIDPAVEREGDLLVNAESRIEHYDGANWQVGALLSDVTDAITTAEDYTDDEIGEIVIPVAGTGVLAVGAANSSGSSANFARVDHVHAGLWVEYTGA